MFLHSIDKSNQQITSTGINIVQEMKKLQAIDHEGLVPVISYDESSDGAKLDVKYKRFDLSVSMIEKTLTNPTVSALLSSLISTTQAIAAAGIHTTYALHYSNCAYAAVPKCFKFDTLISEKYSSRIINI